MNYSKYMLYLWAVLEAVTQEASVAAYLQGKWGTPPPLTVVKSCIMKAERMRRSLTDSRHFFSVVEEWRILQEETLGRRIKI